MIWIPWGKWLSANKLSSNLVKTEYMILATSAKINALGLIIDEALIWEPYIQLLRTKIASAISAIKQANFLPKKSLVTLYQSLVKSRLRYCDTVWDKLQKLQNRAARVVTKTKYGSIEPDVLVKNRVAKCSTAN